MKKTSHFIPAMPQVFLQLIAKTLIAARKSKRMRQDDLAERVGVTRQTIARMEKGDPSVAIGIFVTAAWILDVPLMPGLEIEDASSQQVITQLVHWMQKQLPKRISAKNEEKLDDDF